MQASRACWSRTELVRVSSVCSSSTYGAPTMCQGFLSCWVNRPAGALPAWGFPSRVFVASCVLALDSLLHLLEASI